MVVKFDKETVASENRKISNDGLLIVSSTINLQSFKEKFLRHDKKVGELLKKVGDNLIKIPRYTGDSKTMKNLECFSLILTYANKRLYVYRLCQCKIFVKSHLHPDNPKIERFYKAAPNVGPLCVFSYDKLLGDRCRKEMSENKIKISIGNDRVRVEVTPSKVDERSRLANREEVEEKDDDDETMQEMIVLTMS